jgi:hypothetical protein
MSNLEASWYQMMGLSKIFLRNFLIGCFLLLVITVVTLASLLNNVNQERLSDERKYRETILLLKQQCADIAESKNSEYNKLLREALKNQKEIDREINQMKQNYRK